MKVMSDGRYEMLPVRGFRVYVGEEIYILGLWV